MPVRIPHGLVEIYEALKVSGQGPIKSEIRVKHLIPIFLMGRLTCVGQPAKCAGEGVIYTFFSTGTWHREGYRFSRFWHKKRYQFSQFCYKERY